MTADRRSLRRIAVMVALVAAVVVAVRLLPPLLREIFTVLFQAWAIAILAYVVFVALLLRRR